jgi:hypothetical protein
VRENFILSNFNKLRETYFKQKGVRSRSLPKSRPASRGIEALRQDLLENGIEKEEA